MLTYDEAHTVFSYNEKTGDFTWKVKPRKNQEAGSAAGTLQGNGYRLIRHRRRPYLAHRLAWLMVYGVWPEGEIDHINRDRSDNRIANLRQASRSENQFNQGLRRDNKSGFPGVHWFKAGSRWQANIRVNNRSVHLGYFLSKDDAIRARKQAAERFFGSFSRHE